MRKLFVTIGLIAAMIAPVAATANDLHNGVGTTCGAGRAVTWHFIQNQMPDGTTKAGSIITAVFKAADDSTITVTRPADKLTKGGVLHWTFDTPPATLVDAETNVTSPGNFNLSSWTCGHDKKDPPPKK
jgi:hypothetical protein